jgi:hypothetical protein
MEKIKADLMVKYLVSRGWKQTPFPKKELLVFVGPMDDYGQPIVQVIPRSEQAPDFVVRARELVTALSTIEDRPATEVVRDIMARRASRPKAGSSRRRALSAKKDGESSR